MIFSPLLHLLALLLNSVYAVLPAWTFTGFLSPTGGADSGANTADGGALRWFLSFFQQLDRFIPLHDALVPIMGVMLSLSLGLMAFKVVKFILSLVPTISAGG